MVTFPVFVWVRNAQLLAQLSKLTLGVGHTATLWQGEKLLVYGGENEHREYQSDVIIFDLKTAHWTQPEIHGPIPKGRARHAAAVYDDKLFITGGITGSGETYTLDEICYLDLRTWKWSRSWSFVGRFDHSAWVWGGRLWVFGGLDASMERTGELWWLDLKKNPAFTTATDPSSSDSSRSASRITPPTRAFAQFNQPQPIVTGSSGYTANSSSVQVRSSSLYQKAVAPGAISSMRFISGPSVPSQAQGTHFHLFSSGALLDFTTPAGTIRPSECSFCALEFDGMQWEKLADGPELFDPGYRWHYSAISEDGKRAWLLGCATDTPEAGDGAFEEYLSDVLPLKLSRFGFLGNDLAEETSLDRSRQLPASDRHEVSTLGGLGADLATMFDQSPESGSSSDFIITGDRDDDEEEEFEHYRTGTDGNPVSTEPVPNERPIHVHKLILQARWPHFGRVYAAQMAEFHTKKMHVPEPYSVVRAFLWYLYTDSTAQHAEYCPSVVEVAGMLVMANVYDMPRLRLLCLNRLSRELDVDFAATVWERAGVAGEDWLRRRAATFCLTHWGRIVRTEGFRRLSRQSMMELCEAIDIEGRVVGGDELELVGGLGGGKFGVGGAGRVVPRSRAIMQGSQHNDDGENSVTDDDDGMEMN